MVEHAAHNRSVPGSNPGTATSTAPKPATIGAVNDVFSGESLLRLAAAPLLRAVTAPWAPPSGSRIVVAVSGGSDSVALLHLLAALAPGRGWSLVVATYDHAVRGSAGADDARFVAARAHALGLPVLCARMQSADSGSESALRVRRRAFLERALSLSRAAAIALAHTLDDQAETVVDRLARGAGSRGLAAMERYGAPYWRPLLGVRHAALRALLVEAAVTWREDESNLSPAHRRNRIRHVVLPAIERALGPASIEALARAAAILREEDALLEAMVERELAPVVTSRDDGRLECSLAALRALPRALAQRVIRRLLEELAAGDRAITRAHVDAVTALALDGGHGTTLDLPGTCRAQRCGPVLLIVRTRPGTRADARGAF